MSDIFSNIVKEYEKDRKFGIYFEKDGQTYTLDVYYSLGGQNWYTGGVDPRGVFVSITPMEMSESHGVQWRTFTLGSGLKMLIEVQKRYNARKLKAIATRILANPDADFRIVDLFNAVVKKNPIPA